MKNPLLKMITSRKLIIGMLVLLLFLLIGGSMLPKVEFLNAAQKSLIKAKSPITYALADYLSPPKLVKNPLFFIYTAVFLISLFLCTFQRLLNREVYLEPKINDKFGVVFLEMEYENLLSRLSKYPKLKRWHIRPFQNEQGKYLLGKKGKYGFWGSILFHFSIIVILIGALASYFNSFLGGLVVTEGQTLELTADNIVNVLQLPRLGTFNPGIQVKLEKLDLKMYDDKKSIKQYNALTKLSDLNNNQIAEGNIEINKPLQYQGFKIVLEDYGVAPYLTVTRKDTGQIEVDSFVSLKVLKKEINDPTDVHDLLNFPDYPNEHVMVRFFPDFEKKGNKVGTRSLIVKNPVFWINLREQNQLLQMGKSIDIGPYIFELKDLRYWAYFKVSRDPGEIWIWVGFVLAMLGLTLRFWVSEKNIWLKIEPGTEGRMNITIGGYSKYFPELHKDHLSEIGTYLAEQIELKREGVINE